MTGFADAIKARANKILEQIDKKCYSIAWQLFTSVVYLTPSPENPGRYAKGVLANQWYPMVGGEFSSASDDTANPYGSDSLSRINSLSKSKEFFNKDGIITMTNNMPYVMLAETIGWNKTGPYRMVLKSLQKVIEENRT